MNFDRINEITEGAFDVEDPNSLVTYLARSGAACMSGMSIFSVDRILIYINLDLLQMDSYQFLIECEHILSRYKYKCRNCTDAEDDGDIAAVKTFYFRAKNPLRRITFIFNKKGPLAISQKQVLDIAQFVISFDSFPNFTTVQTENSKLAFDRKVVKLVNGMYSWDAWNNIISDIIDIEKETNFVFPISGAQWRQIVQSIPSESVIEQIIKWNTRIKLASNTSIPMILLTVKTPNPKPRLGDVLFVKHEKDQRYIWNIHWDKLSDLQQRNGIPLLQESALEFGDATPVSAMTAETKFEEKFLSGRIPSTCVDIVNAEMEQDLEQFIKEDEDNVVFLFPLKNEEKLAAACYDRNNLLRSKIFYVCQEEDSMNPLTSVRLGFSIFRLDVREFPIYIGADNYGMLLESKAQFFIVNEMPQYKAIYTVSKDVQDGTENMVSADHCQAGSEKTLSMVFPVNSDSVEDAIYEVEGNRRKWRRTYPTHVEQE